MNSEQAEPQVMSLKPYSHSALLQDDSSSSFSQDIISGGVFKGGGGGNPPVMSSQHHLRDILPVMSSQHPLSDNLPVVSLEHHSVPTPAIVASGIEEADKLVGAHPSLLQDCSSRSHGKESDQPVFQLNFTKKFLLPDITENESLLTTCCGKLDAPSPLDFSPYRQSYLCRKLCSRSLRRMILSYAEARVLVGAGSSVINERRLFVAVGANDVDRVRELMDKGVDARVTDNRQRTALHVAACRGYAQVIRLLLRHGADPNARDVVGNTPLHLAACTHQFSAITELIRGGADVSSVDNRGRNPLQLVQAKLRLFRDNENISCPNMKKTILQVMETLQEYLNRIGHTADVQVMSDLCSRLSLSESRQEVDSDVKNILTRLDGLSLNKADR